MEGNKEIDRDSIIAQIRRDHQISAEFGSGNYLQVQSRDEAIKLVVKESGKFVYDDLCLACEWDISRDPKEVFDVVFEKCFSMPNSYRQIGNQLWARFPTSDDTKKVSRQILKIGRLNSYLFKNPYPPIYTRRQSTLNAFSTLTHSMSSTTVKKK
jgi:hypothetical protein